MEGGENLEVRIDPIADDAGGAFYARRGERGVIVVSPNLSGRVRRWAVAHEQEHHAIGVVAPPATEATMEKTENQAERRAVARLLPPADLEAYVAEREADGEPVEIRQVADHFAVADSVAEQACKALAGRRALQVELEREHGTGHYCGTCYPPGTTRRPKPL